MSLVYYNDYFHDKSEEMMQFFRGRDYPEHILSSASRHVLSSSRLPALGHRQRPPSDRPNLLLIYHPHSLIVKRILYNPFPVLQFHPITSTILSEPPLVTFRRHCSLRDILVHNHLYGPQSDHCPGTRPCGRAWCRSCPFFLETETITIPNASTPIATTSNPSPVVSFTSSLVSVVNSNLSVRLVWLLERFTQHFRDGKKLSEFHFDSSFYFGHRDGTLDMNMTGIRVCNSGCL